VNSSLRIIFVCCVLVVSRFVDSQDKTTFGNAGKDSGGLPHGNQRAANAVALPEDVFPIDVSWLSPLFIDVRVNGSAPMRFILDSASAYSMIRKQEGERLGLKTTSGTTLSGGGGDFRMDFATADLQVGNTKLSGVQLGVAELSPVYAGILGDDLFEKSRGDC
jgi:Aspartyl protease